MRSRMMLGIAAMLALAATVLPSVGGQHFGLLEGEIVVLGSSNSSGGAAAGGASSNGAAPAPGFAQVVGFYVDGLVLSARDGGVSLASRYLCITVTFARGEQDHGCGSAPLMLPPHVPDPTSAGAAIEMRVPSLKHRDGFIDVRAAVKATGPARPGQRLILEPGNTPDFRASISVGLERPAAANGSVASSGLGLSAEISPDTPASIGTGGAVEACSYAGAICP